MSLEVDFPSLPDGITCARVLSYPATFDPQDSIREERFIMQLQWYGSEVPIHGFMSRPMLPLSHQGGRRYLIPGYICSRCTEAFLVPASIPHGLHAALKHECHGVDR